tara:strand:- start:2237 stop:2794 length:558 start_codon:yes stop_codon:yes gene_type:complete
MIITRSWAMSNKETFRIKPINEVIQRYLNGGVWVDPFVRASVFKDQMTFTNDLNPDFEATHHMDALEFLKALSDSSVDGVLFDPPYSPRQITECYQGVGRKTVFADTNASFWSNLKKEISRILKPGGVCITCCWNSGGIGKKYQFEIEEVLIVPHGSWKHDTICTVDRKQPTLPTLFNYKDTTNE